VPKYVLNGKLEMIGTIRHKMRSAISFGALVLLIR
jgi:hypothetical protein